MSKILFQVTVVLAILTSLFARWEPNYKISQKEKKGKETLSET
jgi:hypothetical protein